MKKNKYDDNLKYENTEGFSIKITSSDNAWNKAAVCLTIESEKPPSTRQNNLCEKKLIITANNSNRRITRMSTTEWNNLAIKTMEK